MALDIASSCKLTDPYNFIPANEFFPILDLPTSGASRPIAVVSSEYVAADHSIRLRFDDGSRTVISFVDPKIWRVFRPVKDERADSDTQSRNTIQPTVTKLQETLALQQKPWDTEVIEDERFLILQSSTSGAAKEVITAMATVLSVRKPRDAGYLGFGEQGGDSLIQDKTFMNFFNYDNMLYSGVYGRGALDPREPLYHSEPFWIEVNGQPGYQSQIGTFVDNYSHIALDIAKTHPDELRIATRFNDANFFFKAGDKTTEVVRLYTSIVGRPWLKPRYALGYGQGAYGYDTREKVEECVQSYRDADFPLDTMHIDVDLQDKYCTFTVDERAFPEPHEMFKELREKGIKCSTNITPVINAAIEYPVQKELLSKKYYVPDTRFVTGASCLAAHQRYICYEGGKRVISDPNLDRPGFGKEYDFGKVFNSGNPYHGGVNYGSLLGTPGYYPDLNREEVRDWWGKQYRYLFDLGLAFVWQDMTSPSISKEFGDMKSFPARLLITGDDEAKPKQPAIELWSLYSYNLHKATFEGLNRLPTQKGKRNFIIGRGSFAGMHRYAALWTGDNGTSWDFLRITVVQAISLGLSGLVISGGDVGGFMGMPDQKYCPPYLLIRWYAAAFLLPWFRNHYNGKPGQKLFQEPYRYSKYYDEHKEESGPDDKDLYEAGLPVTRDYTRLRYCFMQILYDGLFENIFTGLPIVQALVLSDPLDETLFTENQGFMSDQYVVRKDLLVAPILKEEDSKKGWRTVYLPSPDEWYQFNLLAYDQNEKPQFFGKPLSSRLPGGSRQRVTARLKDESSQDITPMYIREGAILPLQPWKISIPSPSDPDLHPSTCPKTIHIYPGKENEYNMYLDDGESRESAPASSSSASSASSAGTAPTGAPTGLVADPEARGKYRHVRITTSYPKDKPGWRAIVLKNFCDKYGRDNTVRDIGPTYTIMLWQDTKEAVRASIEVGGVKDPIIDRNESLRVIGLTIPVDPDDRHGEIQILHQQTNQAA